MQLRFKRPKQIRSNSSPSSPAPSPNARYLKISRFVFGHLKAVSREPVLSSTANREIAVIEVGALRQQLCTRKRYSPASIAMALSKIPELYKVRLARVRTPGNPRLSEDYWQTMGNASDGSQGGGYEFQFLDGQQRARRTEDLLAASAVVLVCPCPNHVSHAEFPVHRLKGKRTTTVFIRLRRYRRTATRPQPQAGKSAHASWDRANLGKHKRYRPLESIPHATCCRCVRFGRGGKVYIGINIQENDDIGT